MGKIDKMIDYLNNEIGESPEIAETQDWVETDPDFRDLTKIDGIFNDYIQSIQIPPALTENLARKFEAAGRNRNPKKSQGFVTVFTHFINNSVAGYFSAVLSTIVIMTTFLTPITEIERISGISQEPPVISQYSGTPQDTPESFVLSTCASTECSKVEEKQPTGDAIADNPVIMPVKVSFPDISLFKYSNENVIPENAFMPEISAITRQLSRFGYEFRANLHSFIGGSPGNRTNDAMLLNYSIGLWYKLTDEIKIGAEFRQEPYLIKNKTSESEKNMTSWEATMRYIPDVNLLGTVPYLQINLGIGKYGATGRLSAGLNYHIDESLLIIGGVEFGCLMYNNGNSLNINPKAGFNIGFSLGL